MSPLSKTSRRPPLVAALVAGCVAAAGMWIAGGGPASAGTISGTMFRDPDSQVVRWVAANPNDSRMPVIRDKIASQPQARWLSTFNPSTVRAEVSGYVNAANAVNQIPVLSVYEITNRDCGGASAGGAPDLTQYQSWVSAFAGALGSQTVIIVLETDSLALVTCLNATELAARNQALNTATQTIKAANPNARVYLDGGHSAWNSAAVQAARLRDAGVQNADGFFTNVSNYQPTASEASYGRAIIAELGRLGVPGKRQIIDTSRNGGAAGDWCGDDNTDRRIGQYPTTGTNDATIDAYVWVKPPGEADGCAYQAGQFVPALAYSLSATAPYPTVSPTVTPSSGQSSPSSPPASSASTPPASSGVPSSSAGGCTATYQVTSSWSGGFQGQVTVRAGGAGTVGWTVRWTLGSGQAISQLWNGTLTVSGSAVTVTNLTWNGSLPPNGSATFGFIGTGSAAVPTPVTCTPA